METISIEKLKESLQNILNDTLLSHNVDTFFKEKYDSWYTEYEHSYIIEDEETVKNIFSEFEKECYSIALCNAINGIGGKSGYTTDRDWILNAVKWNIEHGADVNYDNDGFQPIFMVLPICGKGYLDVFEELIRNGADVNIKNKYGNTPLIMACYAVNPEFVKVLVDAGADLDIVGNFNQTAEMSIQELFTIEPEDNATDWEKIKYSGRSKSVV